MAQVPTGVTVVAALDPEGPVGATANAVTSLSLDPPLMLACLDLGSRTLTAIEAAGRFGVSVLRVDHAALARTFATKAPQAEKWEAVPWIERSGVPVLEDALAWVTCDLRDRHHGGDHVILIGAVLDHGGSEGDPLVFHRGEYRGLGDEPG
jgi:3-hydroxy-9,10-secoandrosta-1,3,5(10)-triene-9,17-dione monooxygenase reductase component